MAFTDTAPTAINATTPAQRDQGPYKFIKWQGRRMTLPTLKRSIWFVPVQVNFRPVVMMLNRTLMTNIKIEITCSNHDLLYSDYDDSTSVVIWKEITAAEIVDIQFPITAVRITNESATTLLVDLL
jgi:hypothetical protein